MGRLRTRSGVIRSSGFDSNRRKTAWSGSTVPAGVTALASGAATFDQQADVLEPFTIVRTRGLLYIQSDQVAAREEAFGAMGIGVVTQAAASIGVTAVPTPLTEISDDLFFVWVPWACDHDTLGNNPYMAPFDSKSQRKVNEGDTVVVTLENSASGFGVEYEVFFRMLFMFA